MIPHFFCLPLFLSSPIQANVSYENIDNIANTAKRFVEHVLQQQHTNETYQIKIGSLDTRLKLSQCTTQLDASLPHQTRIRGNTSILIRCPDSSPWQLYVPVKVSLFKQVVIATQAIPKNTSLHASHLTLEKRNISKLSRGYYTNPEKVIKQISRRAIANHRIITPHLLRPPYLVKRGQAITLMVDNNNIRVRMPGIALANGIKGARIQARNKNSGKKIEGTVTEAGIIRVD
jgi:flagella basal body P-ring formation protein FlgA